MTRMRDRRRGDPPATRPRPVRVTLASERVVELEVGKPFPHIADSEGPITGKASPTYAD
jgi:hypothetical protein